MQTKTGPTNVMRVYSARQQAIESMVVCDPSKAIARLQSANATPTELNYARFLIGRLANRRDRYIPQILRAGFNPQILY